MKLPNHDSALIDPAKVRDYLLSPEHPVGRFKATFFAAIGYKRGDWQKLSSDLLEIAKTGDALSGPATSSVESTKSMVHSSASAIVRQQSLPFGSSSPTRLRRDS